jgi:hypothetical protein
MRHEILATNHKNMCSDTTSEFRKLQGNQTNINATSDIFDHGSDIQQTL